MSAKHAVLALVIERSSYGYQLVQRVQDRCGPWAWSAPTVYSGLDTLAREDLVCVVGAKPGSTARAAPRAVYEATPQGQQYLDDWMLGCPPLGPVRQELELKILLARPQDYSALIDMAWAQERACAERIKEIGACAAGGWKEILVRDVEIKFWRTRMEWLQDTRETIKTVLEQDGPTAVKSGGSGRSAMP
jgi:DNA-binding PadR family transcriptional regulator